jgi:hypothetical protein
MLSLKLLAFLSSKEPGTIKKAFKEDLTVSRGQIIENPVEEILGRMVWVLKKSTDTRDSRKNLLIRSQPLSEVCQTNEIFIRDILQEL